MKNKELAKKIDNFLPFWEKEENFYKEVLEILNNNDKQYIQEMIDSLKDYYNSEEIIRELESKIKGEKMREARYRVVVDFQGGEFAMYRDYTIEQWKKQALEWCYMDDNDELAEALYNDYKRFDDKTILLEIGEIWAIQFRKVRKDKKDFSKWEEDYKNETLEEFYQTRFKQEESQQ